ncbi:45069_t:CDS:1, partial [Gigaspora margarita]
RVIREFTKLLQALIKKAIEKFDQEMKQSQAYKNSFNNNDKITTGTWMPKYLIASKYY